jgi:hypothetical protein
MNKKQIKILVFLFIVALASSFWANQIIALSPLSEALKGRILLQVEDNGEAWYVSPLDQKRYYLGKPEDAFDLMQGLGLGISNDDLAKIAVGQADYFGFDTDQDGLPDNLEKSLGTSLTEADTDQDGYDDFAEIMSDYNPLGEGKININENLSNKLAGRILLQVEENGEAWYLDPTDNKRYYLGSGEDAFNLMREKGLGVNNENLAKIDKLIVAEEYLTKNIEENYTSIVTAEPTKRQYDSPDGFKVSYPDGWKIRRFPDNEHHFQLTDASSDFYAEDKAVILVHLLETEEDYDVSTFRIALDSDEIDVKKDELSKINELEALDREMAYAHAYEKTIIVKIAEKKYLRLCLVTKEKNLSYINIFNEVVSSLELE